MIARKKSLQDYCNAKRAREGSKTPTVPRNGALATKPRPMRQDENGGLQRSKAGLKRTPLRKVSAKRRNENEEYTRRRKLFLIANPVCQACRYDSIHGDLLRRDGQCVLRADQIHHKDGREHALLLDESKWMAICGPHHSWIHSHPNEARKRRWLV